MSNGFKKKNNCPYCGYKSDSASMIGDETQKPKPGDLSSCLMCCEFSQFDENFKLIKFDLDSIEDAIERNRLKAIKSHSILFWEAHPEMHKRRKEAMINEHIRR